MQVLLPEHTSYENPSPRQKGTEIIQSNHPHPCYSLQTEASALAGVFKSEITIDQIMEYIQGPDFPTGAIMYDFAEIKEAYRTGRGRVVVRAKASIEETKKGGFQIIVTEIPYQVNKARLLMKIADLVRDKKIEGIRDQ
jgi:DNA gyrase subunit A